MKVLFIILCLIVLVAEFHISMANNRRRGRRPRLGTSGRPINIGSGKTVTGDCVLVVSA